MLPFAIALEAGTPTQMAQVTTAMGDVFTLVGSVITYIVGQPLLLFIFAAGLVPIGISVFRKVKKAAR